MAKIASGSTPRWRVLFLLFFASGISGLIYESIWSRYIRLFVGSAATAQILVLSLFMGGMSIGALLAGRFIHRIKSPVVVYGLIEGLIGIYALAFPEVYELTTRLAYDVLFPMIGGGAAVAGAKWVLAAGLILPPCILLGTTFPLMSVGILRRDRVHAGEILALLYFTNSLGAALGALLSGFLLVGTLGLPGTLMVAAALNVIIMLVALRDREETTPITGSPPSDEPGATSDERRHLVWLFLAVAFGTGLSSFMYEIGWIRLLSMVLGSATHSFEAMLSAFVLGLALGGLWVRKRMDRFQRPELALAVVQLIMGMSAIATLPAYELAVRAMALVTGADERTQALWIGFNVVRYLLCLLIMLPATFCAGMTLPLLTHVMLKRGQPESAVGNVYGVNTLGAIAGATTAGLLLMPLIGLKGVIVLGALVDMVLGLALIRAEIAAGRGSPGIERLLRRAAMGSLLVLAAGLLTRVDPTVLTSTVFRKGRSKLPDSLEILSYVDGRTASVTVVQSVVDEGYRVIYTNGKPDASVVLERWPDDRGPMDGPEIAGDEPNQFLVGLIPLMARPESRRAALIGFGSGVTAHTVLGAPHLERLDTIEIEPEMVRGAKFFMPVNYRAYEDPRSHIHFDDAKAYFASVGTKYDFIISEPTNPWVSGVSSLFTVEFYQEAKRYLAPGGILAQWIQGYELSDALFVTVLAAIDREFEDFLIVRIGSRDWVILSCADGPVGTLDPAPLSWPDTAKSFDILGIHDVGQVDGLIVANKRMLSPFLADATPNRDVMPLLDTGAERERFLRSSAEFLHMLEWTPAPLLEVLGRIEARPYPREGIGDYRDPHILRESEQAMLLLRRLENPAARVPPTLNAGPMAYWRQVDILMRGEGDWLDWWSKTYAVYEQLAPYVVVSQTAWWDAVSATLEQGDPPSSVVEAHAVLDAMSRLEGSRLLRTVERALQTEDFPLPRALLTVAGVVALELTGAPPDERREFAQRYMMELGNGESNDDYAYRVLRAYALR